MSAIFLKDEGITFSDVLLVPQYSKIKSRSSVDLSVKIDCGPNKQFTFNQPIIPANMSSILGQEMALEIVKSGGLALLHRFCSFEEQVNMINYVTSSLHFSNICDYIGVSIGVKESDKENLKKFTDIGVKIVCIDIAHGDSEMCVEMCEYINETYPDVLLIAGNVATAGGARRLWEAGADIVKAGIGAGSTCSTRLNAAAGVSQLTAIMNIWNERQQYHGQNKYIISDGGCVEPGDVGKSLCFSHLVMTGNMFAGSTSCPGEVIKKSGKKYKKYVGSSTHKKKNIEGVCALVEIKPDYSVILEKITDGIRSCCSYQGVSNLEELKENPVFVRVSSASWHESKPHDLEFIEK